MDQKLDETDQQIENFKVFVKSGNGLKIIGNGSKIRGNRPKIRVNRPKIRRNRPKIRGNRSKIRRNRPKIRGNRPKIRGKRPKITRKPSNYKFGKRIENIRKYLNSSDLFRDFLKFLKNGNSSKVILDPYPFLIHIHS